MFPIYDSVRRSSFPYVTILLIITTFIVFYFQITNPESFTVKYSLIPSEINPTRPSTFINFITPIFLHGGYLHIISNLWFLWVFGDNVEGKIGRLSFILLYFASGIFGNLIQYAILPNSDIPMLGSSGAVAGILGAYYLLFPTAKIKTLIFIFIFVTFISIPAPLMLGYWFILQIFLGYISAPTASVTGGVAFFAHVAGFLFGFFSALSFRKYRKFVE
jgi:membrane associated rhomboid family serine protease